MFNVWYLEGSDPLRKPTREKWETYHLFIVPDQPEPGVGDKVIIVSYTGEGWLVLEPSLDWKEWPYEVPRRFWQRVMMGIFSGDL